MYQKLQLSKPIEGKVEFVQMPDNTIIHTISSGKGETTVLLAHGFGFNGIEKNSEIQGGNYDFGARIYDGRIGRWWSVDPLAVKYSDMSPYNYGLNTSIMAKDRGGKDVIIIVFPDYEIETGTFMGKIGGLGHAGVLLIDNKTGSTVYYEYGRYDSAGKGIIRKVTISDVKLKDGVPTTASMHKILGQLSKKSGHGGKVEAAYYKSDKFNDMHKFIKEEMKKNSDPDREPYAITSKNCGTFSCDVANVDETLNTPYIFDPAPNSMIREHQDNSDASYSFDPKKNETKVDIPYKKVETYNGKSLKLVVGGLHYLNLEV